MKIFKDSSFGMKISHNLLGLPRHALYLLRHYAIQNPFHQYKKEKKNQSETKSARNC